MDLTQLFKFMAEKQASDMYISAGAPVLMKIEGETLPLNNQVLDGETVKKIAYSLMTPDEIKAFEAEHEMNFGFLVENTGKFRINVFHQRGDVALVARFVRDQIPSIESLGLPAILKELVMEKRGLILVVGQAGSGKSTTLASMIDYRNTNRTGHILLIEDPIEYLHAYKKSIVNQREVGLDTNSYSTALLNAVREAPDVLMIGEIRDRDTMQQAMIYAETGHLMMSTLHANNSYHTLNRIINLFPHEARNHLLHDLSISLKAVISQRLVRGVNGKRLPATEILVNSPYVAELIKSGETDKIKEAMEQSLTAGSQTFEQALFALYREGKISLDEALANADSRTNLSWLINNEKRDGSDTRSPDDPPVDVATGTDFAGFALNSDKV
ncbi:pilus retraction protein PilT [Sulfuricella denitrificans skB26]|uniref:Pilus retraction protein PilT n=1 Tax=Sulfuricella denitrificans (strain DSM 22764 / NBRC 105220 / skB26) TaxID=1163617 RepID=S6AAU5_SULDS|nr:PilT/PilU family type 4a pilus ATPase [Sulfuricella denitrificans]BAN34078.1 pilus retraction protein PilT [Sulfuricella denitrificans skB26]